MAETTILLPGQTIEIPDELQDMFDVVRHTFDPDTPIRKTTAIAEDSNFSPIGNVVSTEEFFMRRLSSPGFPVDLVYATGPYRTHPTSATSIMTGYRNDYFAKLAFTESHLTDSAAARYYAGQTVSGIWQLGIEINKSVGEGRRSVTTIGANSTGEAAGKTVVWSPDQQTVDVHTEYLLSTERFEEIAAATARVLIPGV